MKAEVRERTLCAAAYIIRNGATLRACAARFGVGKTTMHKDMRERLPLLDRALSRRVNAVLQKNLRERHLRGGQATREKYGGARRSPIEQ